MRNLSKKRKVAMLFTVAVLMPLLLFIFFKGGNRNYTPYCIASLLLSMLPFIFIFDKRRPQAKEFIVVFIMTAIAVAARAAFIAVPHFKPMFAVIMITAAALGPETGLLCGAMSALFSNFIFGQGPWTPWQMYAYGAGGLLFGLIFYFVKDKNPLVMALTGALITFAFVGFILDTSAIATMSNMIDASKIWPVYRSGIPVNLVHAASCFLLMFFLSRPILEKLERLKVKYGLMQEDEF